jgi:hypothetical protein
MNWSLIIGNGKTFTGALLLIVSGLVSFLGWLPPQLHLDVSPLTAVSFGLTAIGLGAKLQAILQLFQKT